MRKILLPDGKPRRVVVGGEVAIDGPMTPQAVAAALAKAGHTVYLDDDEPMPADTAALVALLEKDAEAMPDDTAASVKMLAAVAKDDPDPMDSIVGILDGLKADPDSAAWRKRRLEP